MKPHPSIGESLTALAEVAGVPLGGLDDDQLDIVALRLVVECDDQHVLTLIGPIVEEVRNSDGDADQTVEREREARQTLIGSHDAGEARTGLFLVPRRPELMHPSQAQAPATRGPLA